MIIQLLNYNIINIQGYPEVVFLLLNAGLDVKQTDSFGQVSISYRYNYYNNYILSL